MGITDLDNGNFESAIEKGVAVVDFWAPWCGPCKLVAPIIEELEKELEGEISAYKVNVDRQRQIADKYGIVNIPAILIFKDGREADKITGLPYGNAKREIKSVIEKHLQ
jgi:thioredoxin 1